jgi:hypothetical protein
VTASAETARKKELTGQISASKVVAAVSNHQELLLE